MSRQVWHIIVGRYTAEEGGVSDYSELLVRELTRAGHEVHIWTGGTEGSAEEPRSGATVHRVAGEWDDAGLARLGSMLDEFPAPRLVSLQYVPQQYGHRGMNLGFTRWVRARGRAGDDIRPMFHEVGYHFTLTEPPQRLLLALVHRLMARNVMAGSTRAYVSIPAWEKMLRRYEPAPRKPIAWLPVPCTLPFDADPAAVAKIRSIWPEGTVILGTFGTYGHWMVDRLGEIIPRLVVGRDDRAGLILGRGGDEFAARLVREHPRLQGRVFAPGGLPPAEASHYLQACDVLVQPYPDGISTRRTSAMAGLAHGRPIATTTGHLCEPIWAETGAVSLSPVTDHEALILATDRLLDDKEARTALGAAGRRLYDERFEIRWTVERMLADSGACPSAPTFPRS